MSYGRQALTGILFVAAGIVATKVSSFLAQFALGWLLTPEDYKLWGMLVSLRMFVEGIRHGGVLPVMQQRATHARDQLSVYFKYGFLFNLLSALILLLAIPIAPRFFDTAGLTGLILLLSVSFPLSTPGAFYRTQLSLDLRFSMVARITSIVAVLNYGAMVVCAAMKMGPYSFVLPIVVSALAEWWLYGQVVDRTRETVRLTWESFVEIFRASKWIIFASVTTSIALSGDYLVIGARQANILGEYLFGFQLVTAIAVVIASGFQQVLLPTFAKLNHDDARLADAYEKSIVATALMATPVFALSAVASPWIVHLLWAGKWDGAICVVQAMSLCLVFRLINPVGATTLQAVGRWDLFALAMTLDAFAVVLAAWIGTAIGGLRETAIAVGVGRCIVVPVITGAAARCVGLSPVRLLIAGIARTALPIVSVLIIWSIYGFPGDSSFAALLAGILALLISQAATFIWFRDDLLLVWKLFRHRETMS